MRARQTQRYESALGELAGFADSQAYDGARGLCAIACLNALIGELRRTFDAYELEGDVAPVRAAIARYEADMRGWQLRPDHAVQACLGRMVRDLEAEDTELWVETRDAATLPALPVAQWPTGILAIHPDELKRMAEGPVPGTL